MTIAEFNYIESVLWFVIAFGLTIKALAIGKSDAYFKISIITSIAFVVFGISDIIEAQTGAWWRPFSLLTLKAACVITFTLCYLQYRYLKNNKKT